VREIREPGVFLILSYGFRFIAAAGFGDQRTGTVRVVSINQDIERLHLPENLKDSILVAPQGATLEALRSLAEEQIAGLVLGHLDIDILTEFSQQEPLRQLGQMMSLPFPIILVQGFTGNISEALFAQIACLEGKQGVIDATTQLRAGVSRPELLVPLIDELENHRELLLEGVYENSFVEQLKVGDRVMLIREPFAGSHGEVLEIGSKLERTSSGALTTLVQVRLHQDDQLVLIPLTNCKREEEGS